MRAERNSRERSMDFAASLRRQEKEKLFARERQKLLQSYEQPSGDILSELKKGRNVGENLHRLCEQLCHPRQSRKLDQSLLQCLVLYLKLTDFSHLCLFALLQMAQDEANCQEMLDRSIQSVLVHQFNYTYKFNPSAPWLPTLLKTMQMMVGFGDQGQKYAAQTQQITGLAFTLLQRRLFLKEALSIIYEALIAGRYYVGGQFFQALGQTVQEVPCGDHSYTLYNLISLAPPSHVHYHALLVIKAIPSPALHPILLAILHKHRPNLPYSVWKELLSHLNDNHTLTAALELVSQLDQWWALDLLGIGLRVSSSSVRIRSLELLERRLAGGMAIDSQRVGMCLLQYGLCRGIRQMRQQLRGEGFPVCFGRLEMLQELGLVGEC